MNRDNYFLFLNENVNNKNITIIETYANKNRVPIIQKSGLDFLTHIIKISNAKKILEIGTAIGYSAINCTLINENIHVTTIERDEKMFIEACKNIDLFNLNSRIKIIFQDALEVDESKFKSDYDLLFIDAAKSQYQKFFEKYTKCLKKGGIVVTDNLIFHDLIFSENISNRNTMQLVNKIKKYNLWLKNNKLFDTKFFNIGDGIALSIKK